jgi:hypothetical protein
VSVAFATLAAGPKGRELLDISGHLLREWAGKLGAVFHVIDQAPAGYPLAGKFHLSRIIAKFDRTVFVDADVIPDLAVMPDILAAMSEAEIAMHDDLPLLGNTAWAEMLFARLADSQGWTWAGPVRHVWNTGVIVASRRHAELFAPPRRAFPAEHCSEQFLIQLAIERAGISVRPLDKRLNWQWWVRRRMPSRKERPDIAVRHFAGTSQPQTFKTSHKDRMRLMHAAVADLKGQRSRADRRCLYLGTRTEFRSGCSGWGCRHQCELGLMAVPGGSCQVCSHFEDDGRF